MAYLADAGIGTGIHYPVPLHLQKAYQSLGYAEGSFPVTERVSSQILSLPMFPQVTVEQQSRVVKTLMAYNQRAEVMVGEFRPQFLPYDPTCALGRARTCK
jgi:dTDP-4-amino-4,6-dideoxygalactose transaminase